MTIVFETTIGYEIKLHQVVEDSFCVTYGKQTSVGLTYSQAAQELGECIMHALACEGKLLQRD